MQDLNSAEEGELGYNFSPIKKKITKNYNNPEYDRFRYEFFMRCFLNDEEIQFVPLLLSFTKEELIPRQRSLWISKFLDIFHEMTIRLDNRKWTVGKYEVMRLRIICDLVIDSLLLQE